ncbi:MAG: rhamnogalacturonan acetylesterase [Bacteroidaceae bacterium]|nr:rhamnogalacturonan acetylesterase [Bacteroidaceae bacterium]
MNKFSITLLSTVMALTAQAQTFNFTFDGRDKTATKVTAADVFTPEKGYGYDFQDIIAEARKQQTETYKLADGLFYFSVAVPDGNYRVTVTVGSKKQKGSTTVRAESRRLYVYDAETKKGEFKTFSFVVNKRNTTITLPDGKTDVVKIKPRERTALLWDDKLTLEINGDAPVCSQIKIEPADVPTVFLCGNSTVVDQDKEPWASWGQMFTYWLTDQVAVANYAESGLTASSFYAQNRLKKILSLAKAGDFVFIEFGHNDQKEKAAGSGAYYNFAHMLKTYVDQIREKGAVPIFVTPTQRRRFEGNKIVETHGQYPDAMRFVAKDLGVELIELHDMTRTFFEALGVEDSKRSLVHYPAGTFPNQGKAFEDNTHWNPYGAYEISRMIVKGIKELNLPLTKYIKPDYQDYDPAQPDDWKAFHWSCGPFIDIVKPDGN